jgi:hypothetical protein
MSFKEIPAEFVRICDKCGEEKRSKSNSYPHNWTKLQLPEKCFRSNAWQNCYYDICFGCAQDIEQYIQGCR